MTNTKERPEWLDNAVFYEIYPQSFNDTNADGIGDLNGITEKLDYIKELGCTAIWINPCFKSPFGDAGYDVEDYYTIAPRYGTNEDMAQLCRRAHALGIRVLLDLVPGHTSEEHEWFRKSGEAEPNEYSGRYIWTDHAFAGGDGMPFIGGEYPRSATYIIKDVRLFLNSIDRSLQVMRQSGVNADLGRRDTDNEILLTIRIPKQRAARA